MLNGILFLTITSLGSFFDYLFQLVVSRAVSIAQFGEISALIAVFSVFVVVASALKYVSIKYSSLVDEKGRYRFSAREVEDQVESIAKHFYLYLILIFLVLSPMLYFLYHLSSFWEIVVIAIAVFLSFYSQTRQGILIGRKKYLSSAIIGASGSLIKLGVGDITSRLAFSNGAILSSLIFSPLVSNLALKHQINKYQSTHEPNSRERSLDKRELIKTFRAIILLLILVALLINLDVILAKIFLSNDQAGVYAAFSIVGKIIYFISSTVVLYFMPDAFSRGGRKTELSKGKLIRLFGSFLTLSIVLIAIFSIFAQFVISSLFGQKYLFFSSNLWLFGLIGLLISYLNIEANLDFARGKSRGYFTLGASTVAIIIVAIFNHHSTIDLARGFALALALISIVRLVLRIFDSKKI